MEHWALNVFVSTLQGDEKEKELEKEKEPEDKKEKDDKDEKK